MEVNMASTERLSTSGSVAVVDTVPSEAGPTVEDSKGGGNHMYTQTPGHVFLGEQGEVIITTNYSYVKLILNSEDMLRLTESSPDPEAVTDLVVTSLARLDWNGERILDRAMTSFCLKVNQDLLPKLIKEVVDRVQKEPDAHHVQRLAQDLMERYQHKLFGLDLTSLVFLVEHCSVEDAEMTLRDKKRQRQLQQTFLAFVPEWVYPSAVWTVDQYRLTAADRSANFGFKEPREVLFIATVEPVERPLASGSQPSLSQNSSELRVVIVGKTGAGKSSLGNTLLGRDAFNVTRGIRSGTVRCAWADTVLPSGLHLQVTDTPGLCDTHRVKEEMLDEVARSVAVASPGPHVILMALRCDMPYTKEEHLAYSTLTEMFGAEVHHHLIVVFSGADAYGDTVETQEEGLRKDMLECDEELRGVLSSTNHRYVAVNNLAPDHQRAVYAAKLLDMVQALTKSNEGRCYSSQMVKDASRVVEPAKQDRMRNGMSRAEAIRTVNQDIVDGAGVWATVRKNLMESLDAIIPAVVNAAAVALASRCSVM